MQISKKIMLPVAAFAVISGVAGYGMSQVFASEANQHPPFVEKLAERFNLNQNEVRDFFDEERESKRVERQEERDAHLQSLVDEGKITSEQKNLLTAKMEENQASREDMKDLSKEERQEHAGSHQEEMEQWAEENGIDLSVLRDGDREQGPRGDRSEKPGMKR